MKCVLQILVPIEAVDHADAFRQAKTIGEQLNENPLLKGYLKGEGVQVDGPASVQPFLRGE